MERTIIQQMTCKAVKDYIDDEANDHKKYLKLATEMSNPGWRSQTWSIAMDEHKHEVMLKNYWKDKCQ